MTKILVVDDDSATRHILSKVLTDAGYSTAVAKDGVEALAAMRGKKFDVLVLDVWMPRMNGLELLAKIRTRKNKPRVVVMTSDDAPRTVLEAVREHAFRYVHKPANPPALLEAVREVLEAPEIPPIEVISARPEWVELTVPCTREAAERIQSVLAHLDADLAPDVRENIAYAFRELLLNAVEWGGQLDPSRQVRISCVRTNRMLIYRIADPGHGFTFDDLPHAAVSHPDNPTDHVRIRDERRLRAGGFGLLLVRAQVDELVYNEQQNEVMFIKYLD
jgi:CheY-like chemotaxis protein/anti-sigma regulatory factor (Ser/Thr protein kinase)